MENIYEKVVVKPKDAKDNIIMLLTVLPAVALSVATILIEETRLYIPIIFLIIWYLVYRIITSRNIEYEYSFVDNTVAIDKIINKKRRKRIFNTDLSAFDIIAKKDSKYYAEHKNNVQSVLSLVSNPDKDNIYFGIIYHNGKRTMVLIESDERLLNHMKKHLDYKLKT